MRPPHYPLRDWDQIEGPAQVSAVRERLASLPRLDVYAAPDLYDLAYPGFLGDDAYYGKFVAQDDSLYLGVGTGRLFASMAKANRRLVGLDCSAEMLDTLRRRYPDLAEDRLTLADATASATFPADRFDTIVAPYCFLEVVPRYGVRSILENVARWLRPGGRFVTDTFSPFLIPFRRPGLETIEFPCGTRRVAIYVDYDHVEQAMHESTVIGGPDGEWVTDMRLHYFFPAEVHDLFREAGLTPCETLGEFSNERFDPSQHDVVVYHALKSI